jgi:hypothetical protein
MRARPRQLLHTPQSIAIIRAQRVRRRPGPIATAALVLLGAIAVVGLQRGPGFMFMRPLAFVGQVAPVVPFAKPSSTALGKSGEVNVRFSLPGEPVEYPLQVSGDPASLSYQWVRVADTSVVDLSRPLDGPKLVAPSLPGIYQLTLTRGDSRRVVPGLNLAVMVPFEQKMGTSINGYQIGTYRAERTKARYDLPDGFVQVGADEAELQVTKHLRLGDFLSQDGQRTWPRYAAVDARVLDKVELVLAELERWQGDSSGRHRLRFDVTSAFRTPSHNRVVLRSAKDSRHQYGDAIDLTVDANGDGRLTAGDSRLVALAVEMVEQKHPELAGGLGVYTSRRIRVPYVHIDARGRRARWRG